MSISRAGITLVLIPLVVMLFFGVALVRLLAQADGESAHAFRAAQISNSSNKLIRDLFEVGSLTRGEVVNQMTSTDYQRIVSTLRTDVDELLRAVKDDPAEVRIVQKCSQASEEAFELVDRIRALIRANGDALSSDQLDSVRRRLRSCVKRMVSSDLIAMAQEEKDKSEASHHSQAQVRQRIQQLLISGVILNIALAIVVAIVFSKRITGRLRTLLDNSFRLASGLPLQTPIGGTDEIAEVDASFHNMAAALSDAKQKEKSLVEHSLDIICSLDRTGRFTVANPACQQILGYSEDELLGMNLKNLLHPEDVGYLEKSLSAAISGNIDSKLETRIKHRQGREMCLDWSMHWVPFEERFFCVAHDITVRKQAERMKQEIMAMVSHDLRTPLATMGSYHEMLASGLFGELTERGQHLLSVVERNEKRMLTLINDLLDLEKFESGKLALNCSDVKLDELLEHAVKSLSGLAAAQEVNLEIEKSSSIVLADPNRTSQILVNLLSNAIKFSPKNGTITIRAEERDKFAIIHISDEGRGIPEHLRETIFERFHQVEIADAVDKGGSGLGLAICKKLVELHGGKIEARNNSGPGSTFSFSLPLAQDHDTVAKTAADGVCLS